MKSRLLLALWVSVFASLAVSEVISDKVVSEEIELDYLLNGTLEETRNADWWYKTPEHITPEVTTTQDVFQEQLISFFLAFGLYGTDDNQNMDLTFDFSVERPDGSLLFERKGLKGAKGKIEREGKVYLAKSDISFRVSKAEPDGTYTVKTKAYDHIKGVQKSRSLTLNVMLWGPASEPTPKKDLNMWMVKYHSDKEIEQAYTNFLKQMDVYGDEQGKRLNYLAFTFYREIFSRDPFLVKRLVEDYPKQIKESKKKIALMLTMLGLAEKSQTLTDEDLDAGNEVSGWVKQQVPVNPYEVLIDPVQIDMLWAEFFAAGVYKPVKHLLSALALNEYLGASKALDTAKETGKVDIDLKKNAYLEATFRAVLWSMRSNAVNSPRAFQYLAWAYENEKLSDSSKEWLGKTLTMAAKDLKALEAKQKSTLESAQDYLRVNKSKNKKV